MKEGKLIKERERGRKRGKEREGEKKPIRMTKSSGFIRWSARLKGADLTLDPLYEQNETE